jgi:DNA excision repair protein ERCC-4
MRFICDSREPWGPHPWEPYMPGVELVRGCLPTGDFVLPGAEDGAVVERKAIPDFLACIGRERKRFDKELLRARYVASFCIVVEGGLSDVIAQARDVHPNAIVGSVAAWSRRGFPVVFAGSQRLAAEFTQRYLSQQLTEARRLLADCEREHSPELTTN